MMGDFAEKLPGTDDIDQDLVSSDEADFSEPDDGSIGDLEINTWADWCGSAFDCIQRVSAGSGRYTTDSHVQ